MAEQRGQWASRTGFILAAAGSAVGLGNIWRFPYTTGENGGGLFVIVYLLCVALIGVPILMAEIMIGRAAQKQPVGAFEVLQGRRTAWSGVGWLGVVAGLVILSYYAVVAGWAMDYTLKSIVNVTGSMRSDAAEEALAQRAQNSPDQLRQTLVDDLAAREFAQRQKELARQVRPSSWKAHQQFEAALGQAGAGENARAALLEDPQRREKVQEASAVAAQIVEAKAAIRSEAAAHYGSLSDQQVRDEAEDFIRRKVMREKVSAAFGAVAGDGWTSTFWTAVFMLLTILIVAGGISSGIERACLVMMPALFLLLIVLVVYGMFTPGFSRGASFVFKPDVHALRPSSVLAAMGQAFFSLSLGMGAMITYGSYQRIKSGLAGQSITIASMDTAVALLACLAIFPIVFSFGQEPSAGPGLVFMTMPLAFAEIGTGGMLLATMFFGLLVFAAITSSISLLEVVASYFIDMRGWPRLRAAWLLGGIIFLLSLPSAFANDPDFIMKGWQASYGTRFDFLSTMDYMASNWMLPVGGFFIAVYAGWVMPKRLRDAEVQDISPLAITGFLLLARFVAPATVILILMQSIGALDMDELLFGLFH